MWKWCMVMAYLCQLVWVWSASCISWWPEFLGTFAKLWQVTVSFVIVCLSVCMEQWNCHWTGFPEIWNLSIFWKSVKKINFYSNLTRLTGTINEYICTFMIISCSVLLRMRNVSDKSCRENNNTHIMFSNIFPNILLLMR
jgi:hypothetical protein